jgi:hypothetical protein
MESSPDPGGRAGLAGARAHVRGTIVDDGWRFATSLVDAVRLRPALRDVRTYLLFIGHGRSGHSIVGSLLDAHPEAIVSDELDAAHYVARGFARDQVLALSVAKSRRQAEGERRKAGRGGRTYSYLVPGWSNGGYTRRWDPASLRARAGPDRPDRRGDAGTDRALRPRGAESV